MIKGIKLKSEHLLTIRENVKCKLQRILFGEPEPLGGFSQLTIILYIADQITKLLDGARQRQKVLRQLKSIQLNKRFHITLR